LTLPTLNIDRLKLAASDFAKLQSRSHEPKLYGATDGKAVGTYVEHRFREYLDDRFQFTLGNSARGIDFPDLAVDVKVTSSRQPQSSSPFKSASQKIRGLGYALLVFVYEKSDDHDKQTACLDIQHTILIEAHRTADFTITRIIREHIERGAEVADLIGIFQDRNLPIDDIEAEALAEDLLQNPPAQGYLTVSNALQWRLQYPRAIREAGEVEGVDRLS